LSIIVHACFTAGTVERAPKAAKQLNTFAGQLCAALAPRFRGLAVYGYQGMTKAGRAGFAVGAGAEGERIRRGHADPHAGAEYQVKYAEGNGGGVVISHQGAAVAWR
jgi:hypothetical protein